VVARASVYEAGTFQIAHLDGIITGVTYLDRRVATMHANRWVVEVDPSPASAAAMEWCATHVGEGGEVIAVGSLTTFQEFVLSVPPSDLTTWQRDIRYALDHQRTAPLRTHGVAYRTRLEEGAPWRTALDVAEAERADAIVVGHESHGLAFGSRDVQRLMDHANVPVIVVPHRS
jgi:nucleotide-binding universal stress UspA family protein